jgi:hypothetical protein
MINKRISVFYYTLLLLQLIQINLSAQESLRNPIESCYKRISDKRIKALHIINFNPEDSIQEPHSIHWYDRNGEIKKSKIFDVLFPNHETFVIYHHDRDGLSETTIVNGKFQNQQINLLYEGIDVKVFRSSHVDTSKVLFKKIKNFNKNFLDTIKLREDEKISSIIIRDIKNDRFRFSYTKAVLKDGKIYKEITKGYEPDSVVWSYNDEGLTKTYYFNERKSKTIKFSKQGIPILKEEHSETFKFVIENAYTNEGKIMTTWLRGSINKRSNYIYSNNLLRMIEEYSPDINKNTFLRFDYVFKSKNVRNY